MRKIWFISLDTIFKKIDSEYQNKLAFSYC